MEFAMLIIYSLLVCKLMVKNGKRMMPLLKFMIILYDILIFLQLFVSASMGYLLSDQISESMRYIFHYYFNYINRIICLIMFFKIMFAFKKVELQLNPKYESVIEIVRILRKQVLIERLILGCFTVSVVFIVIFQFQMIVLGHKNH